MKDIITEVKNLKNQKNESHKTNKEKISNKSAKQR